MLSLSALSGAAWHYGQFGGDFNPGVFLNAGFLTFYVLDYFVFERVQHYIYDLIHEHLGFKLIWGGLVVYGWLYILPLWTLAALPNPGFSPLWTNIWLIGTAALFPLGWGISPTPGPGLILSSSSRSSPGGSGWTIPIAPRNTELRSGRSTSRGSSTGFSPASTDGRFPHH